MGSERDWKTILKLERSATIVVATFTKGQKLEAALQEEEYDLF